MQYGNPQANRYRGYTHAQAKAAKRYMDRFTRIGIRMDKENAEAIRAHCEENFESMNSFFARAAMKLLKEETTDVVVD